MSTNNFRVILKGTLAPGADPAQTTAALAKLFKTDPQKAAALLQGESRVIRKDLSREMAEKFKKKILATGALCDVELMGLSGALSEPAPSVPKPKEPAPATSNSSPANRFSIEQFISRTAQQDRGQGTFELENERMLEINLENELWIKTGAMISYTGEIRFEREGVLEKGLSKFLKKAVSGEGARLTKAIGQGSMYLADQGKKIILLELMDEAIFVNGNDILALETSIDWDINIMKKVTAVMAGGLFNVRLDGRGIIAITSHYDPLTLRVTPDKPVVTDPNATIAWSGSLQPELKTDISLKTLLGRGSGESIQMKFQGDGFVVVQPFEEITFQKQ
ncbi:MAG: AIM24 family protein [Candidatus Electrothrix sp. GW3-4]|uniref:AIM24 family protein n=1 Tax=Candidatus Electrothrix sp. GW3-4 TaxID=3126740 RepID=UPI0030D13C12